MPLFKVSGKESVLTLHLEHPLHLEENSMYKLALLGFYSENQIHNLRQHANVYFWDKDIHFIPNPLTYKAGYWTIETMQKHASEFLATLKINANVTDFKMEKYGDRVVIYSPVKFYLDAAVSKLLGFTPSQKSTQEISNDESSFYESGKQITAQNPPNLRSVDVIEIHCDLVQNSCVKHDVHEHKHYETNILYSFFPNVPHGYKISQTPTQRHYIPIKNGLRKIQTITIKVMDQDNQLVQNKDVNNIVYLDLTQHQN